MAEGFLRAAAGDFLDVESAGTNPSTVNPLAIRVMDELGIDISHHRSKSVDEMTGRGFDYVITVCDNAREHCPVFPGSATRLHWSFEDPAGARGSEHERLEVFRRVRDLISVHVREFVSKLKPEPGALEEAGQEGVSDAQEAY
jgi:arsenate reductase